VLTYSAGETIQFGQLIFRNITEILATRCQILKLKCINIDFICGSVQEWESLQRSPDPPAEIREHSKKMGRIAGRGREGKGKVKGLEGPPCVSSNFP